MRLVELLPSNDGDRTAVDVVRNISGNHVVQLLRSVQEPNCITDVVLGLPTHKPRLGNIASLSIYLDEYILHGKFGI